MKVVINKCFGGFGLSDKAIRRYMELKGMGCYPEEGKYSFITYWTVPPDERPKEIDWHSASQDERGAYNAAYEKASLYDRDIKRDDPILVQVVEELGHKASGAFAELRVVEIPDGISYEIDEYDGIESIAETHRKWG